jgi:hypothetical protein
MCIDLKKMKKRMVSIVSYCPAWRGAYLSLKERLPPNIVHTISRSIIRSDKYHALISVANVFLSYSCLHVLSSSFFILFYFFKHNLRNGMIDQFPENIKHINLSEVKIS